MHIMSTKPWFVLMCWKDTLHSPQPVHKVFVGVGGDELPPDDVGVPSGTPPTARPC